MDIQEVVDFICKTPENTNPNVVKSVLENMEGSGGGSTLYQHEITLLVGDLGSDPGCVSLNCSYLMLNNCSSEPIETKADLLEALYKYGPCSVDGEYISVEETYTSTIKIASIDVGKEYDLSYNLSVTGASFEDDDYVTWSTTDITQEILAFDTFSITDKVNEIQ